MPPPRDVNVIRTRLLERTNVSSGALEVGWMKLGGGTAALDAFVPRPGRNSALVPVATMLVLDVAAPGGKSFLSRTTQARKSAPQMTSVMNDFRSIVP